MKTHPPLIGITLDSEEPGGYSKMPWYALRQNYCDAVASAGGAPLALPHEPDMAAIYLDAIKGLVVTGGAFDVDPALFGDATRHATVKLKTKRTQFELAIVQGALARGLPVLGICGGQQLLNVALGGTLIQHIPDEVAGALAHEPRVAFAQGFEQRREAVLQVGDAFWSHVWSWMWKGAASAAPGCQSLEEPKNLSRKRNRLMKSRYRVRAPRMVPRRMARASSMGADSPMTLSFWVS